MIDVEYQINTMQRVVGSRVLEAGEARTATLVRTYNAAIQDVWDACTNPKRIPRWFLPISGDLRLGGRYQLEGNAGGTIERCDPPNGLNATWEFGGGVSWIELRLSSLSDGKTRLELEHVAHVDDERWLQYGPGATGVGWDLTALGLDLHLTAGASHDPQEVAAWAASDEAKHFMALSSQRWAEASVASGTDPDAARAAAERTTAFYTGTPTPA